MKPGRFSYVAPSTLAEVHEALGEFGDDGKLLAGGQSLGPLLNLRLAAPRVLIDLERVEPLASGLEERPDHLWVPAMTRHRTLELDPTAARIAPLLSQALPHVAHRTIRNRGTIGGSLAHADSAAELPTVAVASDAVVVVEGPDRRRRISAGDFFEGFFTTALEPDEVIVGVEFPGPAPGTGTGWAEFAPRSGDYAIVGVAVRVELDNDMVRTARIVCAGVSDIPWRASVAEEFMASGESPSPRRLAEAARAAAEEATPRSDASGSSEYRKNLVRLLTEKAAAQAVRNAQES